METSTKKEARAKGSIRDSKGGIIVLIQLYTREDKSKSNSVNKCQYSIFTISGYQRVVRPGHCGQISSCILLHI
jgi:hypothetical protein